MGCEIELINCEGSSCRETFISDRNRGSTNIYCLLVLDCDFLVADKKSKSSGGTNLLVNL